MPPATARARRRRACALALTLTTLLVGGLVTGGWTSSAQADGEAALVLDHGHVDAFTLLQEDGRLRVRLKEDVTGRAVLHDPEDVLLRVTDRARMTLPSPVPDSLSFLGRAGDTVWFLPQTQDQALLWPGWSTERLSTTDFTGPARIHVERVEGPGTAYLWQTGTFGRSQSVLDGGGYRLPGDVAVNPNSHVHANWAFTRPGRYELTVHVSATRAGGGTVTSEPATYAFDVGEATTPDPTPTDPTPTDPTPTDPTPTDPTPTDPGTPGGAGTWDVRNGHVNRAGATVLNAGHVDVASVLREGRLDTRIKDTTRSSTPVWRDPARTVLQLRPSSRTTAPGGAAWSFLGRAGSRIYQVTQVQQPGLLWPGWSTESIPEAATTGGVRWALTDVSGPGDFALYETDPFGRPAVLLNTRDGLTAADRLTIPKITHAHGSWAFSRAGQYCLSMQRVAQTAAGRTVSDSFVLAVAVGTADVTRFDPAQCGRRVDTDPPVAAPPPAEPSGDATSTGGTTDLAATGVPAACAPTTTGRVISAGHVDYATRIVDGRLRSQVGDDTTGTKVFRDPASTVLWLKPSSRVTLPAGYGSVGRPGTAVWQVPQTQDPALVWLGWNTEQLNAGTVRGPVTWRLDRVEGPGSVAVYLSGTFGGVQQVVLDGPGSSYRIPLGVHAHANWAFGAQGVYRLTMTQSATLADGTRASDTAVLTVAVGDVDPARALATSTGGCAAGANAGGTGSATAQVGTAPGGLVPETSAGSVTPLGLPPTAATSALPRADELDDRVPLLLGVLGALLLLGSAGSGVLWWRRA